MRYPLKLALFFALAGCRENLSAPPLSGLSDSTGPVVHLTPANDTLADSAGLLLVHVTASDVSGIKTLEFFLLPATSSYNPLTPLDTAVDAYYSVPLGQFKHGVFRFYAKAADILDHQTVTDTVTVTVR